MLRRVLDPVPHRLLDLGCGSANVLAALGRLGEAVGMEADESLAATARAEGLDVRRGAMPVDRVVPAGWPDVVLLLDVLEHLDDDGTALRTAHSLLEPGGTLRRTGGCGAVTMWRSPERADWRHHEILALLERDQRGAPVTVSVVPNFALFSVSNFRFYAVRDGLDMRFVRAWDDPPLGIDYMVLKTGDQGPSWTAEKSRRAADRLANDPHFARVFPVIADVPLPDGSTAIVRARRILSVTSTRPAELAAAIEAGLRHRLAEVARDVEGLQVRLVYDDGILGGRLRRVEIHAAAAPWASSGGRARRTCACATSAWRSTTCS
jgi:SAM-dependent methyltransferase